jgi:hypothetical protein
MNNLIRPQKISDLHTAEDALNNKGYVEVYFSCCFYEMFPFENPNWQSNLNGSEIKEILALLDISVFDRYIWQKFTNPKNQNAEVYHSAKDERVFAYFDLQKKPEDKHDSFFFGLSFKTENEPVVLPKVFALYKQLQHCSPLTYDLNQKFLYNKVFRSNFYFYKNNYNPYGRLLQHHGLRVNR